MGGRCREAADARSQSFDGGYDAGDFPVWSARPHFTPAASSNAPGVVALAMGVTSSKELSVTPRALVPVGSQTAQSSVGTAIRADVSQHVSFVSDVGAAGTTQVAGIRSPLPVLSGIGVERKSKQICCAARRRSVHQMSPLSGRSIARSSVVSCGPSLA